MEMKIVIYSLMSLICYGSAYAQNRISITFSSGQPSELIADAGIDVVSGEQGVVLGGTPAAIGGIEPYYFEWIPDTDLDDATISNPILNGDGDYEFALNVTDTRGCTATDSLSVSITYIDEIVANIDLLIYPNPASRTVTIASEYLTKTEKYAISVVGSKGDIIFKEEREGISGSYQLDISTLSEGTYLIFFHSEVQSIVGKLIIKN